MTERKHCKIFFGVVRFVLFVRKGDQQDKTTQRKKFNSQKCSPASRRAKMVQVETAGKFWRVELKSVVKQHSITTRPRQNTGSAGGPPRAQSDHSTARTQHMIHRVKYRLWSWILPCRHWWIQITDPRNSAGFSVTDHKILLDPAQDSRLSSAR